MDADIRPRPGSNSRLRVLVAVVVCLTSVVASVGGLALLANRWLQPPIDQATEVVGASTEGYTVWERNIDGRPVRWDPCSPIEIVVASPGAPAGTRADIALAVARLREASGLDVVITGATDERPAGDRPPFQPERYGTRWAPILVGWAAPGEDGLPLRRTDRGVAIPIAVGPPGERVYVSGQVVLNAERDDLRAGTADRSYSWGATIMHELVHVLGLGHVDDPAELMHVYPGEGPVALGDGDRAGLRAVGAGDGCLEIPAPRPVEVARPPGG